ncbi:MAG: hypothetical protein RL885_18785 [Planctomycetota bacterium]
MERRLDSMKRYEEVASDTMKGSKVIWLPAGFCAFLSLMKLFLPGDAGGPAFFSFLPMCFFFTAAMQLSLWKRIALLESALQDKEDGARSQPRAPATETGSGC